MYWYYIKNIGTEDNPKIEEIQFDFEEKIMQNYTLFAKYEGEAVLTNYKENQYFWKYKEDIISISFKKVENLNVPNTAEEYWNVERNSDSSPIIAFIENAETGYQLNFICERNTIYASHDMSYWFQDFINLKSIDFGTLDTSKTVFMYFMFNRCKSLLSLDLGNFDTKNVKDMTGLFLSCENLISVQNLNKLNTENVIKMTWMFQGCKNLIELDVSNFDTKNVTNMQGLFNGCEKITQIDVNGFDTSKVTNMQEMFRDMKMLTSLDLHNFDTSIVESFSSIFRGVYKYNISKC